MFFFFNVVMVWKKSIVEFHIVRLTNQCNPFFSNFLIVKTGHEWTNPAKNFRKLCYSDLINFL